MFKLNKDVLFLIFEELQDESRPLYSSLLVNKFWLETVIPVLWKNPWRYVDFKSQSKISLYNILTSFLSKDTKGFLTSQGIKLPSMSNQAFLFDYLSFCRSFNVEVVNNILSIGSSSAYKQFLLQQEIYSLFMKKCPQLKHLDIISLKHQLFCFPEAKIRLEALCELTCETATDDSYFYGLARICQNIQRLVILNTSLEGNHGILVLIEVQKNLKYFEWKDNLSFDYYIQQFSYKDNFMALKKKADTLIYFAASFYDFPNNNYYDDNTTFPPELLPELYNLKTLKFNTPFFRKFVYEVQLKMAFYSNLEILQLDYSFGTITSIIKNSGGKLRKILTSKQALYDENFYDDSLNFISAVYKHCPLVECLSLGFPSSVEHFLEFEKLLKACPKLKVLILEIESTIYLLEGLSTKYWMLPGEREFIDEKSHEKGRLTSGEKLSNALIRSAPITLRELRFYSSFKFSLITLEEFLENWRGRPALTIYTLDRVYETGNYVKLIEKYTNEGVIEDFINGSVPVGYI